MGRDTNKNHNTNLIGNICSDHLPSLALTISWPCSGTEQRKKLKLGSDNDEGGVSPSPDSWFGILGLLKVHIGVP